MKFPVHHKNRHQATTLLSNTPIKSATNDDIEEIIVKAYYQAVSIMNSLQLTEVLEKHNLNSFKQLNEFVFQQLTAKSSVDYSYFNEDDLFDSSDNNDSNNNELDAEHSESDLEHSEYHSDEDEVNSYHMASSKETFKGMRIYDQIDSSKKSHYFQININNKTRFIHKQSAARLLTVNNNRLSSDRQARVQQINKQY